MRSQKLSIRVVDKDSLDEPVAEELIVSSAPNSGRSRSRCCRILLRARQNCSLILVSSVEIERRSKSCLSKRNSDVSSSAVLLSFKRVKVRQSACTCVPMIGSAAARKRVASPLAMELLFCTLLIQLIVRQIFGSCYNV